MTTNCPECGHDWLTPGDGRLCGKPHCFCRTCAAASPQEDAAQPVWDAKAAFREGFQTRELDFDTAWNDSLTKYRTAPSLLAVPEGRLRELIDALRRGHYVCEDYWYSCPMSGECCDGSQDGCTCGAEAHNKRLDDLAALLASVSHQQTNRSER